MNADNIGVFIPGFEPKNIANRDVAGAIEKKSNTEKATTVSPTFPGAGTALEAAPGTNTSFHPEKVSIIMPAFNAENTIGEAIASALNGTHRNLEILVIDDGSTDGTENTVTDMARQDERIKYHKNPKNLGAYKSRNVMLSAATGQFIAFLDSDDTWEPNKLEECLKLLKQHPEVKSVGHALRYLDKRGNKVGYIPTYPITTEELQNVQENGALPWVFPTALVVEREAILEIGGFLDWKVAADTEFMARLAQKHGMLGTKMPLGNYRVLGNSLTDKYWLDKRLAIECVKENQQRRIRGESELTLTEYREIFFQNLSPLKKLNKLREIVATRFMRKAGESWLNREILPTLIYGIATTALNPQATIHKIQWMKYQKRLNQEFH
ncbi:glycosyltransferase [Lyngbya sp. CCAP 1446/10]|uniref:glycosyltransferase family 2 protein n=1 Tax=Lyngbya sp. CCAP 1446/10 TaxID=439293 RepID=UPI0022377028|nr:glycosyltransferase family 2 protein [Lyngbya sp. CCAP 1446/10]MCW6051779.1 glycosyltransferase [Lyngbya sp. CCAP 1446/10]